MHFSKLWQMTWFSPVVTSPSCEVSKYFTATTYPSSSQFVVCWTNVMFALSSTFNHCCDSYHLCVLIVLGVFCAHSWHMSRYFSPVFSVAGSFAVPPPVRHYARSTKIRKAGVWWSWIVTETYFVICYFYLIWFFFFFLFIQTLCFFQPLWASSVTSLQQHSRWITQLYPSLKRKHTYIYIYTALYKKWLFFF